MAQPITIVAPIGYGKSHLLHALGNELALKDRSTVVCLSTHDFVIQAEECESEASRAEWRSQYRRADVVLLDDFHLVSGRVIAGDVLELLRWLVENRRTVVVTLRSDPDTTAGLLPNLVDLLHSGTVGHIGELDRPFKRQVVGARLKELGVENLELAEYLADRNMVSAREIHTALQRLVESSQETGEDLSVEFARSILERGIRKKERVSVGFRQSGVIVSLSRGFRSREKMVWEWPDLNDRLVGEAD